MKPPDSLWLSNGALITPAGLRRGALGIRDGRLVEIRRQVPRHANAVNVRGRYIAPGLIDLHIWGDPKHVATHEARSGTTSFLITIGPEPPELLVNHLVRLEGQQEDRGARCLGIHLEGPFLNPLRAGALASRWLRPPTSPELRQLVRHASDQLKLVTIAPEIPRGVESIRWFARHRVVVSLGHSDASAAVTLRAIKAGARSVTHVFNGMRPLHHRDPGLLGEVLTDDRLMAMVILDGIHVDPVAFQLLLRCKGPRGIVLVTDSVRHKALPATRGTGQAGARPKAGRGAFYTGRGILAGSRLTMIRAVRNAVVFGKISLLDAVHMASFNPARLLGLGRDLGSLEVGKRADLVVFDKQFRVVMTLVDGKIVYQRGQ